MKKILPFICLIAVSVLGIAQTQNALSFDGIDDYVTTSFSPPSGNVSRTIEAYIKTSANSVPTAGGIQQVIADYGSFVTGGRFTFNVLWGGAIRLEVGGNGVSGSIPVNDGMWHHVAAVYDPSNSAGTVTLYVDGNLDTQGTPTVSVNTSSGGTLIIGRRVDGVNNFTGEIDELRFWDTALSQNDIITGAGTEICPFSTGLLSYYQFNEGVANVSNTGINNLPEFVSGNDGTLQGFSLNGVASNWVTGAPVTRFIDTSVTLASNVLTAAQTGATYQWIDCNTGNNIAGETNASFSPIANGDYAVEITLLGCTQESNCINVNTLSIVSNLLNGVELASNPSKILNFNNYISGKIDVTVHSLTGKELFKQSLVDSKSISTSLSSGLYLVTVKHNGYSKTFKWIKK